MMPKVTVIIATYNCANYLPESLDSVLYQTYRNFEIILVDDGSTDNTAEVVETYFRSLGTEMAPSLDAWHTYLYEGIPIKFIAQTHQGVSKARLRARQEARGQYIALNDADDKWVQNKLNKQVFFLDMYPKIDMVFADWHNFTENGFYPDTLFSANNVFRSIPAVSLSADHPSYKVLNTDFMYEYLQAPFIIQPTILVRKKIAERYHMFENNVTSREQFEFSTRTLHQICMGFVDEVLLHRRIHDTNITFNLEMFHKNTIIICSQARKYPWMNAQCKELLHNNVIGSNFTLGRYYFSKGNFFEARQHFKEVMTQHRFHSSAIFRWLLTFIPSVNMVLQAKSLWHRLTAFKKKRRDHEKNSLI